MTKFVELSECAKSGDPYSMTKDELLQLIWRDWNFIEAEYLDFFRDKWFAMMRRKRKAEIDEIYKKVKL